jgi:hypothetical protein
MPPIDVAAAASFLMSAVMVGLLIWIGITIKKWYNDASTRPKWLMSFIMMFYPVKYYKMSGTTPAINSNLITTNDLTSTTANVCASNCSTTVGCNGFVFYSNNCIQISTDFGKAMMVPNPGKDTYFRQDTNSPKYGFVSQTSDYAISSSSNVTNQRLGTILSISDPTELSNTCISQSSSNCIGFSYTTTSPAQAWLVKDTSNSVTTSNVSSFVIAQLSSGDWVDAGF